MVFELHLLHYSRVFDFKQRSKKKASKKNSGVGWLVLLLYVPSQQLWSLRDGQFT